MKKLKLGDNAGAFTVKKITKENISFQNLALTGIKKDNENEYDEIFSITVPKNVSNISSIIDGNFKHIFQFTSGETIILIHVDSFFFKENFFENHYKDINNVINQFSLKEYVSPKNNKAFGIKGYIDKNYLAIYLNTSNSRSLIFKEAIETLEFP